MHPRAAPDGLLELGHGADFAVEHDQAAGLCVDPGGEQTRGGDDHRVGRLRVDKIAELCGAFGVVAALNMHGRIIPGATAGMPDHNGIKIMSGYLAYHKTARTKGNVPAPSKNICNLAELRLQLYSPSSSSNALASCRSAVSKPSVNQS